MEKIAQHVEALIQMAVEAPASDDTLRLAQAALSAAQCIAVLGACGTPPSRVDSCPK